MICDVLSDINKCGFREWAQKYGDRKDPQGPGSSEVKPKPSRPFGLRPVSSGEICRNPEIQPVSSKQHAQIGNSGLFLLSNTPKSGILACFFQATRLNLEKRPSFFRETRPNPKIQPVFTEETHPNPVIRPTRLLLPRNGKDG